MEDLLTIDEVSKRLKISKATVRRHIREGKLKAYKIGRVVRISSDDLKRIISPIDEVNRSKKTLDWFDGCQRLCREIKERHHSSLLEDSTETIRDLRHVRTIS
ncbi:MAG TPA: helix-turn-helix domain-containing protein [Thermodesulfobacteriota bacterium]|jgi:excisionase family DNA binding protein